ncbi:MAG: esterase/lipase family protein [Acidobacteriota bacterium]
MTRQPLAADVAGVGRLALDAMSGLTDVVESMHGTIARRPLPFGGRGETRTRGITRFVYQTIRAVTHVTGASFDAAVSAIGADPTAHATSPRRDAIVSALNGVLGDHLAATGNPLAIAMQLRRREHPTTARALVLVHGLCMTDQQWLRDGRDHGAALAAAGWTPSYVRYNTGCAIATNGRELSEQLEQLVAGWPLPLDELAIIGHSMGGLVARSACDHARSAGHAWLARLAKLVCLGTPHHGAPLERAGNLLEMLVGVSPYAAPIARLGGIRSAGIKDLRFGIQAPLPERVACFAIAGRRGRLLGDGLVPVASALGHHDDPRLALAFPRAHQHVIDDCDHLELLSSPAVFARIAGWLDQS